MDQGEKGKKNSDQIILEIIEILSDLPFADSDAIIKPEDATLKQVTDIAFSTFCKYWGDNYSSEQEKEVKNLSHHLYNFYRWNELVKNTKDANSLMSNMTRFNELILREKKIATKKKQVAPMQRAKINAIEIEIMGGTNVALSVNNFILSPAIVKYIGELPVATSLQEITDQIFDIFHSKFHEAFTEEHESAIKKFIAQVYNYITKGISSDAIKTIYKKIPLASLPHDVFKHDPRTLEYFKNVDQLYFGMLITDAEVRKEVTAFLKEQYLNYPNLA